MKEWHERMNNYVLQVVMVSHDLWLLQSNPLSKLCKKCSKERNKMQKKKRYLNLSMTKCATI